MTLTHEPDLDIFPLDLHAKNQVCTSVCSVVRVVTHTHTRCKNYDTCHVRDVGCNESQDLESILCTSIYLDDASQPYHAYLPIGLICDGNLKRCGVFWTMSFILRLVARYKQ